MKYHYQYTQLFNYYRHYSNVTLFIGLKVNMQENLTKKINLILCATPFQVLIAEKIIKAHPNADFDLVLMFNKNENRKKFEYYFNRISPLCNQTLLWNYKAKLPNLIHFKAYLYLNHFNKNYDELYLSNIHRAHFQMLVSSNMKAKVITFDDGLANILPSSKLYIDNKLDILRASIWKLLGIYHTSKDIKKKSVKHLTVYKNIPNIVENTEFIELYKHDLIKPTNDQQETIKIYLGQPLHETGDAFNNTNIGVLLNSLQIKKYFPHPREKVSSIPGLEFIDTKLIVEDYIIEAINSNPNLQIEVYSFFSSAIINIASLDKVKCYYIHHPYVENNHKDIYELATMFPNIKIINL